MHNVIQSHLFYAVKSHSLFGKKWQVRRQYMSFYNDKSMNFTYRTIFLTYKRIIFAYKYECY